MELHSPNALWNGGFWEYFVQNVKRNLRNSLKNSQLNFEELTTVLVEVQAVINSRLLIYMSPDDVQEALTHAYLILGKRGKVCLNEEDDTPEILLALNNYVAPEKMQNVQDRK